MNKKWYESNVAIILLLIFFFPVGLFLMWKYTNWNKNVRIAVTAIIVLVVIINVGTGNKQSTNSQQKNEVVNNTDKKDTDQAKDTKANEKTEEKAKATDTKKDQTPQVELGITKEYLQTKLKNIELESIENSSENYYIINFKAKDNLTSNMIKIGILDDIKDISKTLVENNLVDDSKEFYFNANGKGQDKYGNEVEIAYGQGFVKGSELLKCKFDNMTYDDMSKIMENFVMHPSLRK